MAIEYSFRCGVAFSSDCIDCVISAMNNSILWSEVIDLEAKLAVYAEDWKEQGLEEGRAEDLP